MAFSLIHFAVFITNLILIILLGSLIKDFSRFKKTPLSEEEVWRVYNSNFSVEFKKFSKKDDIRIIIERLQYLIEREKNRESMVYTKLNGVMIVFSIFLTGIFSLISAKSDSMLKSLVNYCNLLFNVHTTPIIKGNSLSILLIALTWVCYTVVFFYYSFQTFSLRKSLRTTLSDLLRYGNELKLDESLIRCLFFDFYMFYRTNDRITIKYIATLIEILKYWLIISALLIIWLLNLANFYQLNKKCFAHSGR